jgi:hypothetical protein
MPLRDWIFGKSDASTVDRKRTINELSEFMKLLAEADGLTLGMAAVQAADVASRLYGDTEIELHSPRTALETRPSLLTELTENIIQLQKAGRQFEAVGYIVWMNTLRAELIPEVRPTVKQMWSLIDRGGRMYVETALMQFEEVTGRRMLSNDLFRGVPEGFED